MLNLKLNEWAAYQKMQGGELLALADTRHRSLCGIAHAFVGAGLPRDRRLPRSWQDKVQITLMYTSVIVVELSVFS